MQIFTTKVQSISLFLLLVSLTLSQAPAITSRLLNTFNTSSQDNKFILSKRVESMELSPGVVAGVNGTIFRVNFFDRNAPNFMRQLNVSLPGMWMHMTGTKQTLSCNLFYDEAAAKVAILQFDSQNKTFQPFTFMNVSVFTNSTIPSQITSFFTDNYTVGDLCLSGRVNHVIYRFNPNASSLTIVQTPANWNIQASSENFNYIVSNSQLYRFNKTSSLYVPIYNFTRYSKFTLRNFENRLIVSGQNSTGSSQPYAVTLTCYYLLDSNGTTLLGSVNLPTTLFYDPFVRVEASPKLTKTGFGYFSQTLNKTVIVAKSIDYVGKKVMNLTWVDQNRYDRTAQGSGSEGDFDFNENFIVIRNSSAFKYDFQNMTSSGGIALEQAYQFVGDKVIFFRERLLITANNTANLRQVFDFRRMFIDNSIVNELVLLDFYNRTANQIDIIEYKYGNLASINKTTPTVQAPFIELHPQSSNTFDIKSELRWTYLLSNGYQLSTYYFNRSSSDHISKNVSTLSDSYDLFIPFGSCLILGNNSISLQIHRLNQSSGEYQRVADLTGKFTSDSVTNPRKWRVSSDCKRIRSENNSFIIGSPLNNSNSSNSSNASLSFGPTFDTPNFIPVDVDSSLTYAWMGDDVWKWSPVSKNFSEYWTNTDPTGAGNAVNWIRSSGNKIVAFGVSGNNLVLYGFVDSNTSLSVVINKSISYQSPPRVFVSGNLQNVAVVGSVDVSGTISPKIDYFRLNFDEKNWKNVSVPVEGVLDFTSTDLILGNNVIVVKQLPNSTFTTPVEYAYFIDDKGFAKFATKKTNTYNNTVIYKKTIIDETAAGKIYVLNEHHQEDNASMIKIIVKEYEVSKEQAKINDGPQSGVSGEIVAGKIKVCPVGCKDCACTSCKNGFTLDSNSGICYKCAPGCSACSSSDQNYCTVCVSGAYLMNNTCLPCQGNCTACSGTATSCTKCPPGLFKQGNTCTNCTVKNCVVCSDANTCTTCQKGFVLRPNGKCRSCSIKCSDCEANNITSCTSCAKGLYLSSGSCIKCTQKCLECSSTGCSTCVDGYNANSNGVCVSKCALPCITCSDNQPTACLSCQSGSTLVGSSCVLEQSCSSNSSCTYCGQGLNYVLVSGSCISCPNISNCIQCSQTNTDMCALCKDGFFLSSGACVACQSACSACESSSICTGCNAGYTLAQDTTEGKCLACESPCMTCIGSTTYCTSCLTGFTQDGWRCINSTYIQFSFTISTASPSAVLLDIDTIISALLVLLSENPENVHTITLSKVASGSTAIVGVYAGATSTTAASSALTTGLSTGLGAYTVVGVSVTTVGTSSTSLESGAIAGIVVGSIAVVGITIGIVYLLIKKTAVATIPISSANSAPMSVEIHEMKVANESFEHSQFDKIITN